MSLQTNFFTLLILSLFAATLFAQTPYFLLEDFGGIQSRGELILEHKNQYYIGGQYIIPGTVERNVRVTRLDQVGTINKSIDWINEIENGQWNFIRNISISSDNQMIVNLFVGANVHDCIISFNDDLEDAELLTCYTGDGIEAVSYTHLTLPTILLV